MADVFILRAINGGVLRRPTKQNFEANAMEFFLALIQEIQLSAGPFVVNQRTYADS